MVAITLTISALASLIAGIIVIFWPRLLNYVVGLWLILNGLIGLWNFSF